MKAYNFRYNFQGLLSFGACLSMLVLLFLGNQAQAQVAITLDGQVISDDNIYLEDDKGIPPDYKPRVVVHEDGTTEELPVPEDGDGKPNSDVMYYAGLTLSSELPISDYLKSGARIKGGYLLFSKNDKANRFLVDTNITASSTTALIPEPFGFTLSSKLNSASYQVTVPEGSTGRNTLSHDGDLKVNLGTYTVAEKTSVNSGYTLSRHDYIGELTTGGGSKDLQEEQKGADWFSNRIDVAFKRDLTDFLNSSLGLYGDLKNFTSSNKVGSTGQKAKDLDRIDYGPFLNAKYTMTEKSTFQAGVGADMTHYLDTTPTKFVMLPDNPNPVPEEQSQDEASLAFSAGMFYQLLADTSVSLQTGQRASTNIEGGRTVSRDVSASLTQLLGERLQFMLGGKYAQFSTDSSVTNATDRFEGTAALNITLTPSLAMSLGYSYIDQNADSGLDVRTLNSDYTDNKFYLGLSTGLVGVKN